MNFRDDGDDSMFQTLFNAIPSLIFMVDDDVRILEYNAAAAEFLSVERKTILKRRAGDIFHCLHSTETTKGCGQAPFCKNCVVRNGVREASEGNRVVRKRTRMEITREGKKRDLYALITASPFQYNGRNLTLLIVEDISELAELHRLLPICSICHKIRDDKQSWHRIEAYFNDNWDVDFTHSVCPECIEEHYPEVA